MEKVDHVFFTNEADQNLAIADGIVPKDKTTTITDISCRSQDLILQTL